MNTTSTGTTTPSSDTFNWIRDTASASSAPNPFNVKPNETNKTNLPPPTKPTPPPPPTKNKQWTNPQSSKYHGHRARPSQRSWQNQGNNKRERSPSPTHTSKRSKSQKPPSQTSIFGSLDPLKDDSKITNRTKQISYGKNTLSYDRYLESTPIETRKLSDPWTPDAKADIPNRRWKGMVGEWKRRLHVWDPQGYESKEKVKEKKERKEEKGVVDPTLEFEREEEKEEIGEDLYEENEKELPKFEEFEEDSDDDLL